jgi:cellulose synthase/poly-beta-1,6-N-acetylglucosamine synthase-like glycosyltransferase
MLIFATAAAIFLIMTALFWAIGVWRWQDKIRIKTPDALARVSVIIAGRNESAYIESCLRSILAQDYPDNLLEICFIDDQSDDDTLRQAHNIADATDRNLTILSAPPCPSDLGPKKNALIYGINHTSGDIILLTDADCIVEKNWIRTIISHYDESTGAVCGAMLPLKDLSKNRYWAYYERLFITYSAVSAIGYGFPASATGGNFSYRRRAYEEAGGLAFPHVTSGDDDLMAQAIARSGRQVKFASGRDSVVTEIRTADTRRKIQSAIRHQQPVKYYPRFWRCAYLFSILAQALILAAAIGAFMRPFLWPAILAAFIFRAGIDLWGIFILRQKLEINAPLHEVFAADILAPFYLLIRAGLSLIPSHSWKGRQLQAVAMPD